MGLGLRLGFPYYDLDEEVERREGLRKGLGEGLRKGLRGKIFN